MTRLLLEAVQWFCLVYLAGINLSYLVLSIISFITLGRYARRHAVEIPQTYSEFEPPVTVLVPAYNEERTVVASVRSLLQLRYPQFEIVVVIEGWDAGGAR